MTRQEINSRLRRCPGSLLLRSLWKGEFIVSVCQNPPRMPPVAIEGLADVQMGQRSRRHSVASLLREPHDVAVVRSDAKPIRPILARL
jgi:hypothetical protein